MLVFHATFLNLRHDNDRYKSEGRKVTTEQECDKFNIRRAYLQPSLGLFKYTGATCTISVSQKSETSLNPATESCIDTNNQEVKVINPYLNTFAHSHLKIELSVPKL